MVTAMNKFTQAEAECAKYMAASMRTVAEVLVKQYADPQDQDAAAVALLQLVTELLQQEK